MNRRSNYTVLIVNLVLITIVVLVVVPMVRSVQLMVRDIAASQTANNQRIAEILKGR